MTGPAALAGKVALVPGTTARTLARIGEPEKVAAFVAGLASDRAGSVPVADSVIDGGLTAAPGVK